MPASALRFYPSFINSLPCLLYLSKWAVATVSLIVVGASLWKALPLALGQRGVGNCLTGCSCGVATPATTRHLAAGRRSTVKTMASKHAATWLPFHTSTSQKVMCFHSWVPELGQHETTLFEYWLAACKRVVLVCSSYSGKLLPISAPSRWAWYRYLCAYTVSLSSAEGNRVTPLKHQIRLIHGASFVEVSFHTFLVVVDLFRLT